MKKINTLAELKEERKKLLLRQEELELTLKADIKELKQEMELGHILARAASKLVTNKDNGLLFYTVGSLANFLVKKIVLRKSGLFTKFAAGYAARNLATNIFSENKNVIFNWISSLFQKIKGKHDFSDKMF